MFEEWWNCHIYQDLIAEKERSIHGLIVDKEDLKRDKERIIQDKDKVIKSIEEGYESQITLLKEQLKESNTKILKLSGSLSVRGMIETFEYHFSEKRRGDSGASRTAVWN